MKPTNLGQITFTEHAESKLRNLPVNKNTVAGRIRHGHSEFYRDLDSNNGKWNAYWKDKDIAADFQVEIDWDSADKKAIVVSVFNVDCYERRYIKNDRFERVWL